MNEQSFVAAFRQAGPYINAHRGRTFVILFGGEAVLDTPRFTSLISDLSLLYSLGIQLKKTIPFVSVALTWRTRVNGKSFVSQSAMCTLNCPLSWRDGPTGIGRPSSA